MTITYNNIKFIVDALEFYTQNYDNGVLAGNALPRAKEIVEHMANACDIIGNLMKESSQFRKTIRENDNLRIDGLVGLIDKHDAAQREIRRLRRICRKKKIKYKKKK